LFIVETQTVSYSCCQLDQFPQHRTFAAAVNRAGPLACDQPMSEHSVEHTAERTARGNCICLSWRKQNLFRVCCSSQTIQWE